jgi:hypothetical protein
MAASTFPEAENLSEASAGWYTERLEAALPAD